MIKSFVDPFLWLIVLLFCCILNLRSIRKINKIKKWWHLLVLSVSLLYALSLKPASVILAYPLEKDYFKEETGRPPILDYVVVLGGGAKKMSFDNKTYPIGITFERLIHAIHIFRKFNAKFLILSGGNKTQDKQSEADAMQLVALALKVPKEKIILEENSASTWQEAQEVNKIIKNPDAKIGLITSGIHMKRGVKSFKKYFRNITAFSSGFISKGYKFSIRDFMPLVKNYSNISMILIEYIGIGWYAFQKRLV